VAGQVAGFLLPATVYLLIDILFPDFSRRREIQNPERQPTWVEIRHYMLLTLFNHAWPLAFYFLFAYWTEFQQATFITNPSCLP
jgi:methylsterol monooxygenase